MTIDGVKRVLATGVDDPVSYLTRPAPFGAGLPQEEAESLVRETLGEEGATLELSVTVLDDTTNWIAVSDEIRKPVPCGRFFVHGSHDRARVPVNARGIEIDADMAAIAQLCRRKRRHA